MKENHFHTIFKEESLPQKIIQPGIWKPESSFNTAINLLKFIPLDEDERWQIIENYRHLPPETTHHPVHFENAMRAIYLSYENLSFRNGNPTNCTYPNIRQLCRAINNLNNYPIIKDFFEKNSSINKNDKIEFALTDRIQMGINNKSITGCPEAVYQLRLIQNNQYIGRIGFNIHSEKQEKIISITNIQGIPNGKEIYQQFEENNQIKPFNFLIQELKKFSEKEKIKILGLKNPKKNSELYNTVFKTEKIPTLNFTREKILS